MRNAFRIIAIRAAKIPSGVCDENRTKALQIQKKLGRDNYWKYFQHNYVHISHAEDFSDVTIDVYNRQSVSYRLYDLDNVKVEVSAIVGKNGTGKSSLIDLYIRTINNLAAAIIGEEYRYPAAEHLHFIENVYSDLCFELDGAFYIIETRGRLVRMHQYKQSDYASNAYVHHDYIPILDDSSDPLKPIEYDIRCIRKVLSRFFYSMVCNYSMYGFNFWDYEQERTPQQRLDTIYSNARQEAKLKNENYRVPLMPSVEDAVWLKGLFYKNDGYQTPIVIHPMRTIGSINVITESALARERLLKIFFYRNSKGEYPLRTINGNLRVKSIKLTLRDVDYTDLRVVAEKLNLRAHPTLYRHYRRTGRAIITYCNEKFHLNEGLSRFSFKTQRAIEEFIIYKVIKIILTYPLFGFMKRVIQNPREFVEEFEDGMNFIFKDKTFVTSKLMRAIHYATTDIYAKTGEYSIDEITTQIESRIGHSKLPIAREIDTYLPPPIFDVDFVMTKGDCDHIEFAHLSSGEKQIAYTIGGFLYHVSNVDSAWLSRDPDMLKYKYINVIFDEVEQYYHPELQRRFLYYLLQGLSCMEFKGVKGVNIMMVTHSPFILSDIPKRNLLIMSDENYETVSETFCGNINDMLGNPFFMDYSIGKVAQMKVDEIIDLYESIVEKKQVPQEDLAKRLRKFTFIANSVGDAYIRNSLKEMLKRLKKSIGNV